MNILIKFKEMNSTEKVIFYVFALLPIIDSLNGFFIAYNIHFVISVGQIYRMVTILTLLMLSFRFIKYVTNKRMMIGTIIICSFYCILTCCHFVWSDNFKQDIYILLQWIFLFFCSWAIITLVKYNFVRKKVIKNIMKCYLIVVPLTIIIPYFLGIGFHTYSGNVGFKGFYYANNGISLLVSVLCIYAMYEVSKHNSLLNIALLIINIIVCMNIGTKSASLSIIIGIFFIFLLNRNKIRQLSNKNKLFLFIIFVVFGILLIILFRKQIEYIIHRLIYMNELNGDILNTLTSGRVDKANSIFGKYPFHNSLGYIYLLIGRGYTNMISEMDEIDLFIQYGMVGVVLFIQYMILIYKTFNKKDKQYIYIYWYIIFYSLIVGHVFTNALSTMIFVLILGLATKEITLNEDYNSHDYIQR